MNQIALSMQTDFIVYNIIDEKKTQTIQLFVIIQRTNIVHMLWYIKSLGIFFSATWMKINKIKSLRVLLNEEVPEFWKYEKPHVD